MNLFINAVSAQGALFLFDNSRKIIAEKFLEIRGNESSKLTLTLDDFLNKNSIEYSHVDNIVVVHGPGSFTGVRAICLIVNTIAFSTNANITTLSYFDLFKNYPILKQSSKRDMFIAPLSPSDSSPRKSRRSNEIQIMSNQDVLDFLSKNNITTIYGESPVDWNGEILEKIDYYDIISHIKFDNKKQVDPLYIKKPNIC